MFATEVGARSRSPFAIAAGLSMPSLHRDPRTIETTTPDGSAFMLPFDPTELARWRAWSRREGARAELRSALAHLTAREVATSRAEVWRAVRHDPGILGDRMFWGMLKRMVRGE